MSNDGNYAGKSAYRGDVAASYERDRVNEPVWLREQAWMEKWADTIPANARLLDVPAGTGRFIGIFRARAAKVHAVDVSPDMLTELRRRYPVYDSDLTVELGDAEALPYPEGMFDFVVCWRLIHLLPVGAAQRVLLELARVCRGRLVVEVFGVVRTGLFAGPIRALRTRLSRFVHRSSSKAGPSTPWEHITNYPYSEDQLRALFARCGLQLVAAETLAEYRGAPARIYHLDSRKVAR